MSKKFWLIVIAAVLAISLLVPFAGCASEEQPAEHEIVNLELYSSVARTGSYFQCAAYAELLNKNHPWIRCSHLETSGDLEKMTLTYEMTPERRKHAIMDMSHYNLTASSLGAKPFPKYEDWRFIVNLKRVGMVFMTYDPDIKSPQDLVGKTVAMFPKGHLLSMMGENLINEVWGLGDKVKITYNAPPALKDVMVTGVADLVFISNSLQGKDTWEFEAMPMMITKARPTYFFGVTEEDVKKYQEVFPWPVNYAVMPKGGLEQPNLPPQDLGAICFNGTLTACSKEMDDEVAYELAKFSYEKAKLFGDYIPSLAAGQLAETLYMPWMTEKNTHPGAMKYFKEMGWVK